jgi:8-hydroxy-5-deazaflavin:NADPH oxidoreductase
MKIGIIGSGAVGQTLGTAFLTEGHDVMLGTRDTDKKEVKKWKHDHPHGQAGTFEAAAQFGEILVLAVAGRVAESAIQQAGAPNFADKIVIDTTNPIAGVSPEHGVLKFFTDLDESLMEKTQRLIPRAQLVKAFNSVGSSQMYKPVLQGGPPTMFICGDDEAAKSTVSVLLADFGWETADMGRAVAARAIEPLCMLWCIPGLLHNEWSHAFKLLKP